MSSNSSPERTGRACGSIFTEAQGRMREEGTGDEMTDILTDRQLETLAQEITLAFGRDPRATLVYAMRKPAAQDIQFIIEHYQALRAEVERLQAHEAEWDSKEQALQKSIAEHERVIAAIEARYEQQGQYDHNLVRRLTEAKRLLALHNVDIIDEDE